MSADPQTTTGKGMTWVGRSIRRVEDPALVSGNGRFTGDLLATHYVRFVRSSVASARITRVSAPEGVRVFAAVDLTDVKPIRPMLHKFNYVPVGQPSLANGVVRYVGEPVAVVIASSEEEAEDHADLVELELERLSPVVDAKDAIATGAPAVHSEAPGNVIVEGRVKTP